MSASSSSFPSSSPHRGAHLRLDGISHSFGSHRVLTDITLTVPAGSPVGLIGENGTGKSTLLRIAAGHLAPDSGAVAAHVPGGAARIGLLHQEPPFTAGTAVGDALEDAVAPLRAAAAAVDASAAALARRTGDAQAAAEYDSALERARRLDVWSVDAHVEATLAGLGLAGIPRDRPTGDLSGGQVARLSLAWLLLSRPDVLLLDEPTNHLDDSAARHLTGALRSWSGVVLLASHDRAFLDATVGHLVDLDPSPLPHALTGVLTGGDVGAGVGVTRFTGSYTDYVLARLDAQDRWEKQHRDEQEELSRLRAAVADSGTVGHAGRGPRTEARSARKFYADRNAAVVSRRLRSARARLAELEAEQIRKPPAQLWFRGLLAGSRAGSARRAQTETAGRGAGAAHPVRAGAGRVVAASGAVLTASAVAIDGRLAPTSLTVGAGEKWLVTGANGVGKSTLMSVLASRLEPSSGSVHRARGIRVGFLAQSTELPDPHGEGWGRSASQVYADGVGQELAARVPLSTFGLIAGRDENRPVGELSGGQRRRLVLAIVLADPPDVLLLDEPTNHLSLLLVTQLQAALPDYPGAVVVASHDLRLREGWTGRRLELPSRDGA